MDQKAGHNFSTLDLWVSSSGSHWTPECHPLAQETLDVAPEHQDESNL